MVLQPNIERFTGFADCYDAFRPKPPTAVIDLLTQLAGTDRPELVVDLGSGTGLSSRIWSGRAVRVIGVEPSEDMRKLAESIPTKDVSYIDGLSSRTGLPDGCANIITASQALHWMEPEPTFTEVARILRPGGIFAAYDCDWPPCMNWEAEVAYNALISRVRILEKEYGIRDKITYWNKREHLERMQKSGRFRYINEVLLYSVESGNADRLVGLALSQGNIQSLFKLGLSEEEIGVDELREVADRTLGNDPMSWYFSYRVKVGVK